MKFLISQAQIAPQWLVLVGFAVGALGGFFGVGGSFLAGPALYLLGLPINFVVGTDTAHIVGKSVVAARKHYALGNVDIKLGLVMAFGTIPGVEVGARLVEHLKKTRHADMILGLSFCVVLLGVAAFIFWDGLRSIRAKKLQAKSDRVAFDSAWKWVHRIRLAPMISFRVSEVRLSLWAILAVSLIGGFFSGFLGGGAGYIRMPMFVFLLGIPTHVAIGTDLFEIILSAGYGTVSHALKGNVDVLIALVMHTGAALGAQIGAQATERFHGAKIRLAFAPLPILGAAAVLFELHRKGFL
jgi:hypothetical protein